MTRNYVLGGFLVTAGLLLAPVAQAFTQVSVAVPPQFTVNAPGQFQISISDINSETAIGKVSIEPANAGAVKTLEQFRDNSWAALPLQAEGSSVTAAISPLSATMSFRLTFSASTKAVVGFTALDATGTHVLSSSAYPVSVAAAPQVLGSSIYVFNSNLGFGNRNAAVTELQKQLTELGIFRGPITGYFGPLTLAAVREYQKRNNIPATGFVGPLTRASLNK